MNASPPLNRVVTFGCRLNAYESEAVRARAAEAGLEGAIIFNTCAVTAEAVRQSRQAIRRARRENPQARIIVTGCAAQIAPDTYAAMDEVDAVLGNAEKLEARSYADLGTAAERVRVNDIMGVAETAAQFVDSFDNRTRAFLQVQNGCDHRCTFCIIPYGRGASRSVPVRAVIAEAERLCAAGFAELILTGVDLTSYGTDLPGTPSLGSLVRTLLAHVPQLKRLRISSLDSIEADEALWRAIAEEERLMPHFHLSVQAGDDLILKRMKRRHLRADTIAFCERVRTHRPEAAFGADLIAGFPTETEAMAENTRQLVFDAGLTYLHIFPYSAREGTPAARMPQVPGAAIKARATALRELGQAQLAAHLSRLVGGRHEILAERGNIGRTRCFAAVKLTGGAVQGTIQQVAITGHDGQHAYGAA